MADDFVFPIGNLSDRLFQILHELAQVDQLASCLLYPIGVLQFLIDPALTDFEHLPCPNARWMDPGPAFHNLAAGLALGLLRIQAQHHVEMAFHEAESAHVNGEHLVQQLQSW